MTASHLAATASSSSTAANTLSGAGAVATSGVATSRDTTTKAVGADATDGDFDAVLMQVLDASDAPLASTRVDGAAELTVESPVELSSDSANPAANELNNELLNGLINELGLGLGVQLLGGQTSAVVARNQMDTSAAAIGNQVMGSRIASSLAAVPVLDAAALSYLRASGDGATHWHTMPILEPGEYTGTADFGANMADSAALDTVPSANMQVGTLPTSVANQIDPANEHLHVRAHVGAATWADELGAKLSWLTERGVQSASLQLAPEHLGPLEIRISINNDQASVWFGAAHADTRTALEQSLPRLRELLASQGLNLADAGVFREPPREQAKNNSALSALTRDGEQVSYVAVLRARGMIDAYA